jgi:hypothetical protein
MLTLESTVIRSRCLMWNMRRRWQLILPSIGLMLFGCVTYESLEGRRYEKAHGQYFWWASIPLDAHHLDQGPGDATPCRNAVDNCVSWEPRAIADPGWLTRTLILSAFPTFLIGIPLVRLLGRHGPSEIWSFMILMPLLITAWYYAVGWLIDRFAYRRSRSA